MKDSVYDTDQFFPWFCVFLVVFFGTWTMTSSEVNSVGLTFHSSSSNLIASLHYLSLDLDK